VNIRRFLLGKASYEQDGWRVAALPVQKSSLLKPLISHKLSD
jgi:hypothetical protein